MAQRLLLVAIVVALAFTTFWLSRAQEPAPPVPVASGAAAEDASPVAPVQAPVAVPAVREDAPRTTVAGPAELTRDVLQGMLRLLDAGELEVLVVRGTQPVAGASVRVWPRGHNRPGNAKGRGAAIREGNTDATGRVRFLSLVPDDLVVRADHEGRWLEAGVKVVAQPSGAWTVVLAFGSAAIVGSVRDDSGAPCAGVPVYVVNTNPSNAVVTGTDEAGRFEVSGLHEGRYHVQLEQKPENWSAAYERMLTLQPGERARMDFGGPAPAGSLRGRIVDAEGNAVHGERRLRLRHVALNDERRVRTSANGEFTIALPPGRWEAFDELFTGPLEAQVLAAADIDRAEVRADVVWPGIRFLALVTAPPDVPAEQIRTCLSLGGDHGWLQPDAAFVADGQTIVQWTTVAEGRYVLQIGNGLYFVDAPSTGVAVHVTASRVQRVFVNIRQ